MASADDSQVLQFYDGFADDYHLAYAGHWEGAMERQAQPLHELIQAAVPGASSVLDCSCGIGTQAIGLARLGYRVVGSDISLRELERARREAARLAVPVTFVAADFRDLSHVDGSFDVVISCDNAIPHLLAASDVARALRAMWSKLRPGGLLLITMRDFDQALETRPPSASPPVVVAGPPRQVLVRLHEWEPVDPVYTVHYLVLTETGTGWTVREHSMRYRAITRAEMTSAADSAGFSDIEWPSGQVVVGGQQVMTARRA